VRAHHDRRGDAGGLDTVVPQEFVTRRRRQVTSRRRRAHRRQPPLAGEDLARGEAALRAGRVLRPADLGLLASLGQAEVPVRRRLRVAFFSTGDELRSIGEPLTPAASTTATATRCGRCCSGSASSCSTWASCATTRGAATAVPQRAETPTR
jgi:hypothetical protein